MQVFLLVSQSGKMAANGESLKCKPPFAEFGDSPVIAELPLVTAIPTEIGDVEVRRSTGVNRRDHHRAGIISSKHSKAPALPRAAVRGCSYLKWRVEGRFFHSPGWSPTPPNSMLNRLSSSRGSPWCFSFFERIRFQDFFYFFVEKTLLLMKNQHFIIIRKGWPQLGGMAKREAIRRNPSFSTGSKIGNPINKLETPIFALITPPNCGSSS